MRTFFTLSLVLLTCFSLSAQEMQAPNFEAVPAVENLTVTKRMRAAATPQVQRASTCGQDTLLYPLYKRNPNSQLRGFNTVPGDSNISIRAMWFPADDSVTISGAGAYAFFATDNPTTQNINISVWSAGPDSLPVAPLYQESFTLDNQNAGIRYFDFAQDVKVGGSYVLALANQGDSTLLMVSTDPVTNDGQGENLAISGITLPNGTLFDKSGAFFSSGVFNADFLLIPMTTFDFDVAFDLVGDTCISPGVEATFVNNSSPILSSRFYNFDAFLGAFTTQADSTFFFDMGDGIGIYPTDTTFTHTYVGTDSATFDVNGSALFLGMSDITCFDDQVNTYEYAASAAFSTSIVDDTVFISSSARGDATYDYGDGTTGTDTFHVYNSIGTYSIQQIAVGCGSDTTTQDVTISVASINGLSQQIEVFPNPSQGIFNVNLTDGLSGELNVKVTNLVGQEVFRSSGQQSVRVDLSGQVPGVYLLQGSLDGQSFTRKLIVE